MDRLFKRSDTAKYFYLNKMWDFVLDPENEGVRKEYFSAFPENSRKMVVPSCWNNQIDLFRYTGTAWYRTYFDTCAKNIYLKFDGVQNECDVYVDGRYIGNHYGGFLEFGFEVNDLKPGRHEIVLRVNNETNMLNTYPLTRVDWYNYGGIARPVEVIELDNVFIKDIFVKYELKNNLTDASLEIEIPVKTYKPVKDRLKVYINDEAVYEKEYEITDEAVIKTDKIELFDIELWGIFDPNLYLIKVEFGGENLIERIGFREIKTKGRDILLNGEKIKILGINRHEEHPDWGFAVPFHLIKKDIDIIKHLNCNAIRASHYPNSKKTADYMDEIGMLFWEELPLWGRSEAAMTDPLAQERVLSMEKEMIERDFNHPSIIIWSMHNECATDTKGGYELTEKMTSLAREMDSSRLVTYVSYKSDKSPDICWDLADIVCINRYISWYNPAKNEDWNAFVKRMEKTSLKDCKSERKPFIMTEMGAGAIAGVNTFEAQRWTEDYQSASLKFSLGQLLGNKHMSGTYIWQYADIRTAPIFELERPRSFNNKGLVDEYRRPKRAYDTVREIYRKYMGKKKDKREILLFDYKNK